MKRFRTTTKKTVLAAAAAGLAGVALASPASAAVEQHIEVAQCTHTSGNNQGCNEKPGAAIETYGPGLDFWFTASPSHCSDIQVTFIVDGHPASGGLVVGPGQTVKGHDAATKAGHHYVQVEANGIPGGCNQGTLLSWAGTLGIEPAPVQIDNG